MSTSNMARVQKTVLGPLLAWALLALIGSSQQSDHDCIRTGSCSCKFANGSIIDLASLAAKKGEPTRFTKNITSANQTDYYWYNPCTDLHVFNDGCNEVAACHRNRTGSYLDLGSQATAQFNSLPNGTVVISYYTNGFNRKVNVTLLCGEESFAVHGELPKGSEKYQFILTTKCACPDGCKVHEAEGLSTGSVLCIIFFVSIFVYFAGGMVMLKLMRGAEGKEMIPHYDYWVQLPILISEGVNFAASGCKPQI